jgi:hypothetical protein
MLAADIAADDPELRSPRWEQRNLPPTPFELRREILAAERSAAAERLAKHETKEQPRSSEVAELGAEVAGIQQFLKHEMVTGIADGLKRALPALIARHTGTLTSQVNALEEKVADLEARTKAMPTFCGVFEAGRVYEPGNQVIKRGGLWVARCQTTAPPGGSDDWQLCVKAGNLVKASAA